MSKIKLNKDKYGDIAVTINVNVPVEVYINEDDSPINVKTLSERQLLHIIDKRFDNLDRVELGELVLNNVNIERDVERE